jgi:hypothetical protein
MSQRTQSVKACALHRLTGHLSLQRTFIPEALEILLLEQSPALQMEEGGQKPPSPKSRKRGSQKPLGHLAALSFNTIGLGQCHLQHSD